MRIAQMSDIHIGSRFVPDLVDAALDEINAFEPHLVAIPGDLTTKGYRDEFEEAKSYLNRLECENVASFPATTMGATSGITISKICSGSERPA